MASEWGYRLTRKADADLDEIVSYIAVELANPKAASDFLDRFQKTVEQVRCFPESGPPVVNGFLPDTKVRKALTGNYVMYYLPDHDAQLIYVLRIVFGRRSMDEILLELDGQRL